MREVIQRRTSEAQLRNAAELARRHGMKRLKLYVMVGLPSETDDDIDELIAFGKELSSIIPLSLGVAPFVAKRNTPLDGAPRANHGTDLDELIDISTGTDQPIVIQDDDGADVGVIDKATLLKGIQGGKA